MKVNREVLEDQLADFEQRSKELHSQLQLLNETTARLGTDKEQYASDLLELENNAKFYDGEISRVKNELAQAAPKPDAPAPAPAPAPGLGGILPRTPKQGVG